MNKRQIIKSFISLIPNKNIRSKLNEKYLYWGCSDLKNNSFLIISQSGVETRLKNTTKIKGLKIHVDGFGNKIVIHEPVNFKDSTIRVTGQNNYIEIGYANPYIQTLNIWLDKDDSNRILKIGDNFSVRSGEFILAGDNNSIIIGENCMFSKNITIRTTDAHIIRDYTTHERINPDESIYIGDNVWFAQDVHVLKGTKISSDSIVGAGSLVNKKFDKGNVILAGIPAKIVKENVLWDIIPPLNKE